MEVYWLDDYFCPFFAPIANKRSIDEVATVPYLRADSTTLIGLLVLGEWMASK